MRKLYTLILILFAVGTVVAQEQLSEEEKARREKNVQAGNPFAKYGSKAPVATLSKGKYLEVHDLDSIVTIGTMRWHVDRKEIVGRIEIDTLNVDAQPIGDTAGRWMCPDPLSEEFPSWSPYNFVMNSPLRLTDPTGMAPEGSDWIPKVVNTTDSNGNTTGGYLAIEKEAGDTAETLATFLGVDQKQANSLFNNMQASNTNTIAVPESIAGPINAAITDAITNSENYTNNPSFFESIFSENYNCFESTLAISQGKTPDFTNNDTSNVDFSSALKTGYTNVGPSQYQFGQTAIRFGQSQPTLFGLSSTNMTTHGATYLGTSQDGTIYTWSKNGFHSAPGVFKLQTLEKTYGKNQGVGPTKNEPGFYNPN